MKPINHTVHTVKKGTYSEKWDVRKYNTDRGERWCASRHGVRLSGFISLDGIIYQLNNR